MRLTILRIKPNPAGKDRPSHGGPTPSQLGGEWVDFRNDTGGAVSLAGVALYHLAYASSGEAAWQRVMGFKGDLPASEIVRVHSGKVRDVSVINNEDRVGAHHHVFTGDDRYVWNNREGDTPLLQNEPRNQTIDRASYAPYPPEGVVLVRRGEQLMPAATAANW